MSKVEFPNQAVNIQVVVRCRPPTPKERLGLPMAVTVRGKHEVCVNMKCGQNSINKLFKFDQVYDHDATQEQVYRGTIKPIVGEVLTGYNCTVFAYGQTGTGKTHTMEGAIDDACAQEGSTKLGKLAGMIPRAIQQIFHTLERSGCVYTVKLSILELYNEELHDMLTPDEEPGKDKDLGRRAKSKIRLFDDTTRKGLGGSQAGALSAAGGVTIAGLEEVPVRKLSEVLELMKKAMERRAMAETKLNATSSRSHMITTVTLHLKETTDTGEDLWKVGKLNLVDLAGSENILRSGASGKNQKEAGMINQSLLTLGRVINALVEGQPHVPYRESKLTRLLQDSLGGKTKTCVIATIAPTSASTDETASTLEYAHRAKSIKNRPEVNQRMTKKHVVKEMMETNEELQRLLMAAREKSGVYLPMDIYERQEEERRLLRAQVGELEDDLHTALADSRQKDKQLRCIREVLEELQRQQADLKERNAGHVQGFDEFHGQCAAHLDGEVAELQAQARGMMDAMAATVQATLQAVAAHAGEQRAGLEGNEARLRGLMGAAVLHAEHVQRWSLKVLEEWRASAAQARQLVAEFERQVTHCNAQCAAAATAAREEGQQFVAAMGDRLRDELGHGQRSAMDALAGHASQLVEQHAATLPQVHHGVRQAIEPQVEGVRRGLQEMHTAQWAAFDAAFSALSEAMASFAEAQGCSRAAQECQLGAIANRISSVPGVAAEALQGQLQGLHSAVVQGGEGLRRETQAAVVHLDTTVGSLRDSLAQHAQAVNRTAADALQHTQRVGGLAEELTGALEEQQTQVGRTAQFDAREVEGHVRDLITSQDAAVQTLIAHNTALHDRARDFAKRLPDQAQALPSTQQAQERHRQFDALLPRHRERTAVLATESRARLVRHAEVVDGFVATHAAALQPALKPDPMDEGSDEEGDSPVRTHRESHPMRVAGTPLVDPQGRRHMRTPLQEIVNREFFSANAKLLSPGSGRPTPTSGRRLSPASKLALDVLSPTKLLFAEDMEVSR